LSIFPADGGLQDDINNNNNIDQNVTWITPAHNYHPSHHHQRPILLRHQHNHIRHHPVHHWGPFFEEDGQNASNGGQLSLEVPLGGSVHLNCRVGMLRDKTVSIVTSGTTMFVVYQQLFQMTSAGLSVT